MYFLFNKEPNIRSFLVHGFALVVFSLYSDILYCCSNFPVETLEF